MVAVVGLFVATNAAIAAPSPSPYPPPPAVGVAVSAANVVAGAPVDFTGTGFLAGETIAVTVSYTTPDGVVIPGDSTTTVADANGNFSVSLPMTQDGVATLTAVGETSGRTGTQTVNVHSANSAPGGGTTTVPPNETSVGSTIPVNPGTPTGTDANGNPVYPTSTDANGNPVYPTSTDINGNPIYPTDSNGNPVGVGNAPGGGDSGVGSGGLASTGVSIVGPLTIGASALIAGLALLFFGTRLAIRRKHASMAHR